jgi:hypothetical protein
VRPGGVLLLREHDARNDTLKKIVETAHAVFNVVTGESVTSELQEVRNFQPLDFWIKHIENHGFVVDNQRLVQEGDPTANSMVKCTRVPRDESERVASISRTVAHTEKEYARNPSNTYLTAPEWYNVHAAQEYGDFINHTPFYQFPYMKTIAGYWKVFLNSWLSAAREHGHGAVLKNADTLAMNAFIGTTMTLEYLTKALISAPIAWAYAGQEPLMIQALVKDPNNQIKLLDKRINVVKEYPDNLKLVAIPRYKEFTKIMQRLPTTSITMLAIAGNKKIQFHVRYPRQGANEPTPCLGIQGCTISYLSHQAARPDMIDAYINVDVAAMNTVMKELQERSVEIIHIHDF